MILTPLLRGIGIGFVIAAPVGPIGLLCIKRTLRDGWPYGLATGLGAATADAVYGIVVAFGLGAISRFMLSNTMPLHIGGGLLLIWLGISGLRTALQKAAPERKAAEVEAQGLISAYGATFLLTLSNVATIFSFMAVLAALSGPDGGTGGGLSLVAGVFLGSAIWWLVLVGLITALRSALPPKLVHAIEITAGALLCVFGLLVILSGLLPA